MPFAGDLEDNYDDGIPIPMIGTDILENLSVDDDEAPLDSGSAAADPILDDDLEAIQDEVPETVVRLDDEPKDEEEYENGAVDDEDIEAIPAPKSAKKSGRASLAASLAASRASTPAKTPKSAKSFATAPSTGRKRKSAAASDNEPAAKRPGRGRAAAAAAQDAIKQGSTKHPKTAPSTAKAATKANGAKRGPKAKVKKEEPAGPEYEVEKIIDHGVDNKTKQHMYLVKWVGYGDGDNTWEPKTNLAHAAELLKEYDAKLPKGKKNAPAKKAAAKKASPKKTTTKKVVAVKPAGRRGRPVGRRGRPKKN